MADASKRRALSRRAVLTRLDRLSAELDALRALLRGNDREAGEDMLFGDMPRHSRFSGPVRAWIEDRCDTTDAGVATRSSELYADFAAWCSARRLGSICTPTAFGRALRDLCMMPRKNARGLRMRVGIRLRNDVDARHA